jgi:hypothetical protein
MIILNVILFLILGFSFIFVYIAIAYYILTRKSIFDDKYIMGNIVNWYNKTNLKLFWKYLVWGIMNFGFYYLYFLAGFSNLIAKNYLKLKNTIKGYK